MENMIRIEAESVLLSVSETIPESRVIKRLESIRDEFMKLRDRYIPERFPEAYLKVTTAKVSAH